MFLLYTLFATIISSWILSVHALPISYSIQTTFYKEKTKLYDVSNEDEWFMSQEYDVFSSITDYYENMVDSTLSSESEELLLNLIHLPKESLNKALKSQAQVFGMESLSDKQIRKMPSIIGKHIQAMNAQVYQSVENIITLYWHTIWDPKLLTHDIGHEEHILSFLSSFNGIVAKKLMDQIDEYDLVDTIKSDLINVSVIEEESTQQESSIVSSWFTWAKNCMIDFLPSVSTLATSSRYDLPDLETDFLRQHISGIRTSLLMELHIQFMDFFTRVQSDIVDQLSAYYDE